jgi:hypothetical protein
MAQKSFTFVRVGQVTAESPSTSKNDALACLPP